MDSAKKLRHALEVLKKGRSGEAIRIAKEVIQANPESGSGYLVLGHALFLQNRIDESITFLRLAVAKAPDSAEAHAALAGSLRVAGRVGETYGEYVKALELAPESPDIQIKTANFLLEQGMLADAESLFRMAAARKDSRGISGQAAVLERRGDFAAALALLEQDSGGAAGDFPTVSNRARLLWRLGRGQEAVRLLEDFDISRMSALGTVGYFHLLADIRHDLGDYDQAFAAYRRANAAQNVRYDRSAESARITGIIETFSRPGLAAFPRAEIRPPAPIFIVGAPRSGTSLLEQILSCHPDIHAAGELDTLDRLVVSLKPASQADLNEVAERYLAPLREGARGSRYVTDKMPHNFLHLGFISLLFPEARIIHCLRDPMDTGLSIFRRNFSAMHRYATDLAAIGHFLGEQRRLMRHWQEALAMPMFQVSYEELVVEPETVLRNVLTFLNLPWHSGLLHFHRSDRVVTTASYDQVRKPFYTSAVGCAAHYSQHLGVLREALVAAGLSPEGSR